MKLRAVPLSLLVSFALLILAGTAVLASIDETDGAMEEVEPPSSVEPDEFDSDDTIFLFEEQTDVVLSSDLDVDIKNPGTFDWTKLVTPVDGGTILAGTSVHSYFIHFDPASDGGAEPLTGSVTFDTDILGLIVLNAALNDSDPILGAQNEEEPTIYPTGDPGRRMELDCCADPENFDVVFLSSDRRTVEVTVFTDNDSVDQIRVVTAAEQGPPPTPEVPDRPAFSLDTPLPTEDACLCMPPFMVVPDDGIHTWWVRTDGGELRITPIAVGVNILEIGDLNFEVFDPADNSVASRTITYVGLGAESERAGADVVISGTADGDLYRVEVTLTPPSPGTPTAHHYRLETKGASLIGANSPLQTQAEPIPTAWVLNVLDGGSGPEDLDVLVAASPLAPATSGTVEVRDPSGTLVHTGTLGTPIHLTGGPAGQWTVTVLDADGHYVVDKTTGVDRGVYLNWKSFGTGTLTVNPLQLGLPYLGLYKVRIEDVESGMVRHEPPGPPFSGGPASISLEVGEYRVRIVSIGRTSAWADVSVTCNGEVTVTLDLPALLVDIDLKPGSWPNSINLNGNGVQAVALFGSPALDVANVDVDSVRFGVVGDEATVVHNGHIQDVNDDSFPDIVFHFRESEMGIPVETPGEEMVDMRLTGLLSPSGVAFVGTDVARITPNNSKSRGKGGKGPK